MALFYLKEGGKLKLTKLARVVILITAGFVFAIELSRPDPGLTGGVILTCLLVSWLIFVPVISDNEKGDKKRT